MVLCCIARVMGQSKDSVIQYRTISGSFDNKSRSTTDKRHYEYMPISMHAGDVALLEYSSTDFVTALMVRDSLGHQGIKEDDTTFFRAMGSKITLPFKAPADGPYYFVFLTKLPQKTGKYSVHIFYYNAHNNHVTSASPFCDKLKYITSSSYTAFEFLKGNELRGPGSGSFTAMVNLLPGTTGVISSDMAADYTAAFPASADLAGIKKKFEELDKSISTCLADHIRKVQTAESLSDFDKKNFVSRITYTLGGSYPKDLNGSHALANMKDRVVLWLDKDGAGKYRLKVVVE